MPFHIYRASAGAGKTFTLVKEYLRLALASDDASAYAHIMAITFTNKAAGEMKERIFNTLEDFKNGEVEGTMAKMLQDELGISGAELSERSGSCLKHMLHNYGLIAISTIDNFTLRVLKGFAVELGLPSMFEVTLDQDELKVRITNEVLAHVGENSELTDALVDFVEQRTEHGKAWKTEYELQKLAGTIFSEDGRLSMRRLEGVGLNDFKELRIRLYEFNSKFKEELTEIGNSAIDLINSNGIQPGSMSSGKSGIHQYFTYLKIFKEDKLLPNKTTNGNIDKDNWASGICPDDERLAIDSIKDQLLDLFNQANAILDDRYSRFSIYKVVLSSLHGMSLLAEMKAQLDIIQQEEEIVSISEFNHLINKEVMDQPAPFIYERLGHRYRHCLVDEFQDTSVLQWMNLLPLIDESLGTAGFSMVVGDGKQSIYRWRGGKVEQFSHLPKIYREDLDELSETEAELLQQREENLDKQTKKFPLDKNYRSAPTIVNFNNGLFRSIAGSSSEETKLVYEGLEQEPTRTDADGYVQLAWQEAETKEEKQWAHCTQTVDWVQQSLDDGYKAGDIAVLCRKNEEVRMAAASLMAEGFKVVSNDALLVESHPAVRLSVDLIKWHLNPTDRITCGTILRNVHHLLKPSSSLNDFMKPLKVGHESAVRAVLEDHFPTLDIEALLTLPLYQLFGGIISALLKMTPPAFGRLPFQREVLPPASSPPGKEGYPEGVGWSETKNLGDSRIAAFMEFVAEQSAKDGIDIQTFLEVWEEKSGKLCIAADADEDAIRILTVHSAKGLQFPVVIHPFVDYASKPERNVIWAKTDRNDLKPLSVVRTHATKALEDTDMRTDRKKEVERSELDVINTLYVALTRPEDRLYVSVSMNGRSLKDAPKYLVDHVLEGGHDLQVDGPFELGETERKMGKSENGEMVRTMEAPFVFNEEGVAEVRQVSRSRLEDREQRIKSIEHGKIVHALLESIESKQDVAALEDSELLMSVEVSDRESVLNSIRKVTEHEEVGKWFDSDLEVLNERDLMDSNGKIHRPDRLVRGADSNAILEYKTGNRAEVHEEQLGRYVELLGQIDAKPCEAYLVYLPEVEVVKV